ncbi:MAG: hypothetical protein DCC75_07270 [Proteobacteria bacterium]|nr:MAG: hypothetical protein DCC75_07270 [Pseudomonadota bacterium]
MSEPSSNNHFTEGAVAFGRFKIQKLLGSGSIGNVYLACHVQEPDQPLALKVLSPELSENPVMLSRFKNEIRALHRVNHPNVVRGYELMRFENYFVYSMEYIEGRKLSDVFKRHEKLAITTIGVILSQLCKGLTAIHAADIIHRDLKPDNIMVTPDWITKITDFSVARCPGTTYLTQPGEILGTVDYLSPEYLTRGDIDERLDIYSLGIIAYQMLTGVLPYAGMTDLDKISLKVKRDLSPSISLRPDCPPILSDIVGKATTRKPEKRYLSPQELLQDLQKAGLAA